LKGARPEEEIHNVTLVWLEPVQLDGRNRTDVEAVDVGGFEEFLGPPFVIGDRGANERLLNFFEHLVLRTLNDRGVREHVFGLGNFKIGAGPVDHPWAQVGATFLFRFHIFVLLFFAWFAAVAIMSPRVRRNWKAFLAGGALLLIAAILAYQHLPNLPASGGSWTLDEGQALERFLYQVHTRQSPTAYPTPSCWADWLGTWRRPGAAKPRFCPLLSLRIRHARTSLDQR